MRKLYKIRMQSIEYQDLLIKARDKEEAVNLARKYDRFAGESEFVEFLPLEEEDKKKRAFE